MEMDTHYVVTICPDDRVGKKVTVTKRRWLAVYPIYQPLRSGRIWHEVNF